MVTRSLPFHQIGGMEAAAWDLARALVAAGADLHLLTTPCPVLPIRSVQHGVAITTLPGPTAIYSRTWANALRSKWEQELAGATDVVLSVSAGAFPLLAARDRIPFVMQAHGTSWGELLSKIAQRSPLSWLKATRNVQGLLRDHVYRQFTRVVAVGDAVEQELLSLPTRWLVGKTPVTLIPNGIDPELFSYSDEDRSKVRGRYGIPPQTPVVVSTCRLHAQKGVAESLSAISRVRSVQPDVRYLIVGEGPAETALRDQVATEGLGGSVVFVGKTTRERLREFLSAADLFLFTGLRHEVGLTLSILEALAAGLPCVVSTRLANNMPNLLGVPPRDPAAISAGILTALATLPTRRASLLPSRHTLAHAASCYLALFEDLLSSARGTVRPRFQAS